MIGVIGGTIAAVLWGTSGFVAARSARAIGSLVALAWVYIVGLAVALPVALSTGAPEVDGAGAAWAIVTAAAAVASLFLMYAALERGPVVLVMPLTAAQGGLAALLAVGTGEQLHWLAAAGLVAVGLGLAAVIRAPADAAPRPAAAIVLALLSAATAAAALFGSAEAGGAIGTPWLLVVLRATGVVALALPLAASGRLHAPGRAGPLVVYSGLADTGAFAAYIIAASRDGVVVPAVLATQYATIAAVLGILALGERPTRPQLAGVGAILIGVAVVTAVQA